MNKVYVAVAGGTSYILPVETMKKEQYQIRDESPQNLIWLKSVSRSTDVPPANHRVWQDLKRLFAEVNAMPIDANDDDTWLEDLRSGDDERIKRFYESEE